VKAISEGQARRPLRYRALWLGGGVTALGVILVMALLPMETIADITYFDKLLHLLAFVFLTIWFLGVVEWRRAGWVMLVMLGYGVLIELVQSRTAYRMAEPYDVLADGIGIVIGWALAAAGLRHWCVYAESMLRADRPADEKR
jgi:hypothetical protein